MKLRFSRIERSLSVLLVMITGCWSQPSSQVVVYTALDREFSEPIFQQFEQLSGITVRAKYDTESNKTVGLTNSLIAERNRTRCDLFWNNEIINTLRLERSGLLDSYTPSMANDFPDSFKSARGRWYGFAARARVLIVNTDLVNEKNFPTSIHDLADPRWKGRVGIAKPLFGTTATHAACLFAYWGKLKAENYFKKVLNNAVVYSGNKQVAIAVRTGQLHFGLTDTDDAIIEIEKGYPVKIVYPDQGEDGFGTLFLPNTLALMKQGPNPENARRLIDYLLTIDVETRLAQGPSAQIPLNQQFNGATRLSTPREIRVMPVDFNQAVESWRLAMRSLRAELASGEPPAENLNSAVESKQPEVVVETPATTLQPSPSAVRAAGLRILKGRHLILYTDLPPSPDIDNLPEIFDQAVRQWRAYFVIDEDKASKWQMIGCLMNKSDPFRKANLLPEDLPTFHNGFQQGTQFWVYDPSIPYYRRHLLLHEGTHGFMNQMLGDSGPPWYSEGIAERFATHTWRDGRLQTLIFPDHRNDFPGWGRIKIIRDDIKRSQAKSLDQLMDYPLQAFLQNPPYGWSWAAVTFLDRHPKSQNALRSLGRRGSNNGFNHALRSMLDTVWDELSEQWQLFVLDLDYGYDFDRELIDFQVGKPLVDRAQIVLATDHGWQSSGIRLEAGNRYFISAHGRYQLTAPPDIWWCEPGGVTIEYHRGRPLGMVLCAVRQDSAFTGLTPLARPVAVGRQRTLVPKNAGTLFFRINERANALSDNQGTVHVEIEQLKSN